MGSVIKKFRIKSFKQEVNKIRLKNISMSYNKRQILDSISLNIRESEIVGLLGPNGVGKSTFMNLILGTLTPTFGNIYIDNIDVTKKPIYERTSNHKLSIVPQSGGTFFNLSCYDNLKAIGEIVLKDKHEMMHRIEKLISKFELDAVRNIKSKDLSGGQRKKLAISLSLLTDPKIILMDEPMAGLDPQTCENIQKTIVQLQIEDPKRCFIICEHSYRELIAIADRLVILANQKIVKEGPVRDVVNDERAREVYFTDSFNLK